LRVSAQFAVREWVQENEKVCDKKGMWIAKNRALGGKYGKML